MGIYHQILRLFWHAQLIIVLVFAIPSFSTAAQLAFPGAEGFGKSTIGGRGGKVIEVTNLDDAGPGSLRSALEESGPRTVVFKVGGIISIDSKLKISNPFITIAGQTAPGGGITIRNRNNNENVLKISTNNVIIRYITIRAGDHPDDSGNIDAIGISGSSGDAHDIIIDHVSMSWTTDEMVSTWYAVHNVTFMENIISESLSYSTHPEGEHGTGVLIGSDGTEYISLHRNLLAHNRHRNPRIGTTGLVNMTNNIIYNSAGGTGWNTPVRVTGERGGSKANIIGNIWKMGPDSDPALHFITVKSLDDPVSIYAQDNIVPNELFHSDALPYVVDSAITPIPSERVATSGLFESVLANVGNSARLNDRGEFVDRRDAIDTRIINEVRNGTGRIIDSPEEVGGWVDIANGSPYADNDNDGISNDWEARYGFDKDDSSDRNDDPDGDGYTNLEEFLNGSEPLALPPNPTPEPEPDRTDVFTSSVSVSGSSDDVEERRGGSDYTSSDLELAFEGSSAQEVGLRFQSLSIPFGATIESAFIQFTVDEVSTGAASLTLVAEDTGHSAPFSGGSPVSERYIGSAEVFWSPPEWTTVGDASTEQSTPDLSQLIQGVIDRPDWQSGNAMSIFISGTGTRTAESFDGSSAAAPTLVISYTTADAPTPDPEPEPEPTDCSNIETTSGSIDGVEPESISHLPVIEDSNGNLYRLTESPKDDGNNPRMMKSSDGGASWREVDSGNRPDVSDLEGVYQVSSGSKIYYSINTGTRTWFI